MPQSSDHSHPRQRQTHFSSHSCRAGPLLCPAYCQRRISLEDYTINVCASNDEGDGKPVIINESTKAEAVIPSAPSAVTFRDANPGYTNIVFSWNAVDADGYAYSRWAESLDDNTFRDNGTSTSFDFTGLEQRKNKAFWVIAYRVVPEGISEADAKAAGAVKLNPSGKLVIPSKVASTSAKTLTIERCERTKYDKGYVYKYYDQNGVFRGTSYSMWNTIKNKKSKTKYLIALDTRRNNIIIYKGKKGNWKPYKQFVCACGVDGHRTPRGDFKVQRRKPKFQTGDKVGAVVVRPKYTCWYATKFKGAVFFHSTLYYLNSKSRHAARHVGKHYSHGCVRLEIKNAKWIYKNCKKGTAVISRKYGADCSYGYEYTYTY